MVLVKIAMSTSLFWLPHSESGSSPENGNRAEAELNKVRVMAMAAGDAMSNEMLRVYRFALGALWLGRSGHSGHLILPRALPNLWGLVPQHWIPEISCDFPRFQDAMALSCDAWNLGIRLAS
ncbi:hypothetical protein PSHT_16498 [Puccinia striiformis]|uniref:Uncharacterized protein n=1 Tax=Puccinia striiformis TaxID=27350 RepID=A0A2S4U9M2_9BASI|nr:hypothetical protein PSHT_16498 [Puccinia striiformis]